MAHTIKIPFFAVTLKLQSGPSLMAPLMDNQTMRVNESIEMLAGKYAEVFQRKILNKGALYKLLEEYHDGEYHESSIKMEVNGDENDIPYPDFQIFFDYFWVETPRGFWGVIPALGCEGFDKTFELLETQLRAAIHMDFARNRRLHDMRKIVSAIWFEAIEINEKPISLQTPTPKELEENTTEKKERLLPKLAQKLHVTQQMTFGRKQEVEQVLRSVKTIYNRNLVLVGASGVGKTALIYELAFQQRKEGIDLRIWETTASTMIKELTTDMGWQENLSALCRELAGTNDFLFIRNLFELFEVGQYEGSNESMADYINGYLSRGEINMISECSEEELSRIELRSPNFMGNFQVIRLEEPQEDLEEIIAKKVNNIARSRALKIENSSIEETIRLNRRFTPYAGFPGKPIRFLESIIINHKREKGDSKNEKILTRGSIIQSFCEETGMPVFMVDPDIPMDLKKTKVTFNNNVYGQEKAVDGVVNLLAAVKTALTRSGKPIASFLFVGPTGVGKTEMARVLSGFMFGNRERMVRFDMSEYSNPYAVQRLIGDGYHADGLLTAAVRREPFCVLLFDEIEKADASFNDLLLQILGEGRLTDSKGQLVNFCSTIIIMTSNIGASNLSGNRISWKPEMNTEEVTNHFVSAVQKHFRPELFNRIDQVIPFEPLSKETIRFVVEREIDLLKKREGIKFRRMDFNLEESVLDYLGERGYDHKYGARQLQRTIREDLVVPLSRKLNVEECDDQLLVNISMVDGGIEINVEADPMGLELLLEELDKINFADQVSELRRQIYRLQEGNFYVRLLSELDILENEKKRKKNFWDHKVRAEIYTYYLQTKVDVERLTLEISNMEESLSLATMDLGTYSPAFEGKIKDWIKRFFELKKEIYKRRNPTAGKCYLGIYGTSLTSIIAFYRELFELKDFDYKTQSIWFRESFYNEEILDAREAEEGEKKKTKRAEYIKLEASLKDKDLIFKPKQKDDLLYGVEFEINGDCSFLYLKDEIGLQRWKLAEKQDHNYQLVISKKEEITPSNIHRKDFYKGNPRRIIEFQHLKDTKLNISREYPRGKLVHQITDVLDDLFEIKLNIELL